jgi:biopolymer transport protein ExbD
MAGKVREGGSDDLELNHEINVTPFIDVMLVLLIIFMVAAPLATVDVNVDLPAAAATPAPRPDKPLYLTVKEDLTVLLGNDEVARDTLPSALDNFTGGDKEQRVFLRAGFDHAAHLCQQRGLILENSLAGFLRVGAEECSALRFLTGSTPRNDGQVTRRCQSRLKHEQCGRAGKGGKICLHVSLPLFARLPSGFV